MTKLFFDIEGTLVDSISSWVDLHEAFDTKEENTQNYYDWLKHNDAHKWAQSDIKAFKGRTYDEIWNIIGNPLYFNGVKEAIPILSKYYDVYLISGGFGILIEHIADTLNVPRKNLIYHRVYQDGDEWKVDDNHSFHDKSIIGTYDGFKIAIGNGQNDIDMFSVADYSIGVNLDPRHRDEIIPYIDVEFDNFMQVAFYLDQSEFWHNIRISV